jgi:uncharacterized membrane protein
LTESGAADDPPPAADAGTLAAEERAVEEAGTGTDRLLTLSDGVFAIAITLLILEIKVPEVPRDGATLGTVLGALLHEWPQFFGYLLGFLTIGIMWANHCTLFRYIKRADHALTSINTLLMLCVAFVPFSTLLLAEYLPLSVAHQKAATIVYCVTSDFMALAFNGLWRYTARHPRLLDPGLDARLFASVSRRFRFGPLLYLFCTALAWVSVPITLFIICGLALLYALPYDRSTVAREERAVERIFSPRGRRR